MGRWEANMFQGVYRLYLSHDCGPTLTRQLGIGQVKDDHLSDLTHLPSVKHTCRHASVGFSVLFFDRS